MAGMAFPIGDKYYVKCPRNPAEMFAAYYIYCNPNTIFVPVVEVNWERQRYITERGNPVQYWNYGLAEFIRKAYLELKRINITHDDIIIQNIVCIGHDDYRLIDFESMRYSKSHFKDFCLCNQLLKRISNNKDLIPRT